MRRETAVLEKRVVGEREAAEKIVSQQGYDFWEGKTPCWEMCHCLEIIKAECPALRYTFVPCWEIEGTYCKLDDYGATGRDTSICKVCPVYKRWGNGKPIQISLFGKGIDTALRSIASTKIKVKV